jgi:hypothetical protein
LKLTHAIRKICRQALAHRALLVLSASLFVAPHAVGAGPSPANQARGGIAGSLCGEAGQDRGACLREEAAARAEMKKGTLESSGDNGAYERNALARCASLPAADRADCERRMREGAASGSVTGGGIYRELVTPVPAAGSPPAQDR